MCCRTWAKQQEKGEEAAAEAEGGGHRLMMSVDPETVSRRAAAASDAVNQLIDDQHLTVSDLCRVAGLATQQLLADGGVFGSEEQDVAAVMARAASWKEFARRGFTQRIVSFFSKSKASDDLGIGEPNWRNVLSNFYRFPQPLVVEGRRYPSVEHAFHAAKYLKCAEPSDLARKIAVQFECEGKLANSTLTMVKKAGGRRGMQERGCSLLQPRWEIERGEAMWQALEARWCVDGKFRHVLETTREHGITLVHFERSASKSYWGGCVKADGTLVGRNRLGLILMELREGRPLTPPT